MKALKQLVGALHSWVWWLGTFPEGFPPYCEHVKTRMLYDFCPNKCEEKLTALPSFIVESQ